MTDARRPLRVAQVIEATTGGAGKHVRELLAAMPRPEFAPTLIYSLGRDPTFADDVARLQAAGVEAHPVAMRRGVSPMSDQRAMRRIEHLLHKGEFDIVHAHSSKAGMLARVAARRAGVPVVMYTPHAFPFLMKTGPLAHRLYITLERWAARRTDLIIAVSPSERQAALDAGICPPERIVTIENGVNPDRALPDRQALRCSLGIDSADLVVGTVGRASAQKGWDTLLAAAPAVVARLPQARFVLAGGGELLPRFAREVARRGLADHVLLLGPRADGADLVAAFDVFALPSLWEGCPYALLEAMAAECPVVASSCVGSRDLVVSEATGLLVPPEDPRALTAALVRLLRDAPLRRRMGEAGRERVRRQYQLSEKIALLLDTYRRFARLT
jgi:glycosyltransferase involved in cell wall biosynthesis